MKRMLLLGMALFTCSLLGSAQTFNGGFGYILDNQEVSIPVTVSGLPTVIDNLFGLSKVCVNLVHTYDSDIKIILKSPDGDTIILSGNHGSGGDNYSNTCFHEDALIPVASGAPPFAGDFIPDYSLNTLNNSQNPNGIWYLSVKDEVPNDSGHVIGFSLTFSANPPQDPVASICSGTNATGCTCPDGSQNCDLLPDMTNSSLEIQSDHYEQAGAVVIGTATPNIGYGPMELHGINQCYCDTTLVSCSLSLCPDNNPPKQMVNQRIYHKNGNSMTTYDVPAGTMQYHPTHGHIHVDHWVYNTLRLRGPGPDPTTWPIIGSGTKVSFCLINLGDCDNHLGDCVDTMGQVLNLANIHNQGIGSVTGCGVDQGIYNGDLDIYSSGLNVPGIVFDTICNGKYYIVSTTDPYNIVEEMNNHNNSSITPITLQFQHPFCCHTNFYADTLHGDAPFQVQFADSSMPEPLNWLWDFGDGQQSTQQFPIHIYTTPGVYSCTLTTHTTDCSDMKSKTSYITVNAPSSVQAPVDEQHLNLIVYPNPATGTTRITYELDQPTPLQLTLTDLAGRQLQVFQDGWDTRGKHQIELDLNALQLANGLYFIHLHTAALQETVKLVKID